MLVLAISVKDHEYLYSAKSARAVSARSADIICKTVNYHKYLLKDGEIWHVHEVDRYDNAYDYARFRAFKIRKGIVKDCETYSY